MRWLVASAAMVAACLVGAASPAEAAPGECAEPFEVVNHRGAQNKRDENSVPAITLAARRGQAVELDVRATSDGVLILMHDARIDRATTGTGFVAEMTYEKLQEYRIEKFGSIIPTLDEALEAAAPYGVDVYLDVKGPADQALLDTAQTIRDHVMTDRVLVTSWNGKMSKLAPDIALQWKPVDEVVTVAEVQRRGVQSVGLYRRQMSHELVNGLRMEAPAVEVHSRLVSSPEAWDRVTQYAIQGALTNKGVGLADYCSPGSIA